MSIEAQFLAWKEEEQLREGTQQTAAMDILAVCEKHFPKSSERGADNLDAPEMLAEAISYFDIEDTKDGGQLYLEWTVEAFIGQKLLQNHDDMLTIYDALVANGCTEDSFHEWNDGDNRLFYIPTDKKVWCATSQNTRYLFILSDQIHVRRYWDPIKETNSAWVKRERDEYKQGFKHAVKNASWLVEQWSDNLLGNKYVRRPDLQWWKDCNFEPKYGDCRDDGYVMSLAMWDRTRVDRAIYFMSDIKIAFLEIRCAMNTLGIQNA